MQIPGGTLIPKTLIPKHSRWRKFQCREKQECGRLPSFLTLRYLQLYRDQYSTETWLWICCHTTFECCVFILALTFVLFLTVWKNHPLSACLYLTLFKRHISNSFIPKHCSILVSLLANLCLSPDIRMTLVRKAEEERLLKMPVIGTD